jgi:DNA-binding PadR family transcriptional regulator
VAVREGLLALLAHGPRHGYRLKAEFEAATDGVWALNAGQVYSTLDRLARDGLVQVEERDGHRSYELTAAGEGELGDWWAAVPGEEPPPRDELLLKVLVAIALSHDLALDVITEQRAAAMVLLQERMRRARRAGRKDDLSALLVADALVVRAEADLRWLDLCEERLMAAASTDDGRDGASRRRPARGGRNA